MRFSLSILFLILFLVGIHTGAVWLYVAAVILQTTNAITAVLATYRD